MKQETYNLLKNTYEKIKELEWDTYINWTVSELTCSWNSCTREDFALLIICRELNQLLD